jgi:predicted ATP-grasp superfamily ATP-dependent carboligase
MAMSGRVLVGFADALAAIESAWSLADDGFEVYAFAREGTRPALSRSKTVRIVEITPPERDAHRSAADLAATLGELNPTAVLPLDDHSVWLCDKVLQGPTPGPGATVAVAGPTGELATLALDKRRQLRLACTSGFAVPPSCDASSEPPRGEGPWIVKPALAVELRGGRLRRPVGRVAGTPAQVREVAAAIGGPAVAQPFIEGTGEGVFGLATANGVTAWSAHRRIRMMNPRGSGSSACRSIPVAEDVVEPVGKFIAACGWRGIFMVELLRDTAGRPWFMELNGRAWGSMALARHRGYEYPAWAVRAALDPAFAPPEPLTAALAVPDVTARHLGREIVHLGIVFARGGAPRLGTARAVLAAHRGERWYNWRRNEPRVLAADTWATVRGHLGRKR